MYIYLFIYVKSLNIPHDYLKSFVFQYVAIDAQDLFSNIRAVSSNISESDNIEQYNNSK